MTSPFAVDIVGFLFTFYTLGFQTIACMILGYYTARRSLRGRFNWVLIGLLAGFIPLVGLALMVFAYFFMTPPATRSRPGYHPPRTRDDRDRER